MFEGTPQEIAPARPKKSFSDFWGEYQNFLIQEKNMIGILNTINKVNPFNIKERTATIQKKLSQIQEKISRYNNIALKHYTITFDSEECAELFIKKMLTLATNTDIETFSIFLESFFEKFKEPIPSNSLTNDTEKSLIYFDTIIKNIEKEMPTEADDKGKCILVTENGEKLINSSNITENIRNNFIIIKSDGTQEEFKEICSGKTYVIISKANQNNKTILFAAKRKAETNGIREKAEQTGAEYLPPRRPPRKPHTNVLSEIEKNVTELPLLQNQTTLQVEPNNIANKKNYRPLQTPQNQLENRQGRLPRKK